jgi:Flp pilus assembly protein TadD
MKDLVSDLDVQDQRDVELLRGLAATHFSFGGIETAHELLDLARLVKPDDAPTLVLSARVHAQLGDLDTAAALMAEATSLDRVMSIEDLYFARALRDQIERQASLASQ